MPDYYARLSLTLKDAGLCAPTLVLDLDRLDENISLIQAGLPLGCAFRLVDKSLPSLPLIRYILQRFEGTRVMSFHPPVAQAVQRAEMGATTLFGKPMPLMAAKKLLEAGALDSNRTFWLIDTMERLRAYAALAQSLNVRLNLVFEVDIGLHRGGFDTVTALAAALDFARATPCLSIQGLMGYEAHISHIPKIFGGPLRALNKAKSAYAAFAGLLKDNEKAILNLGGSTTALLYQNEQTANEIALGSAFLKPLDFDKPSLAALKPALFIATPILKVAKPRLPGLEPFTGLFQLLGLFPRHGCYIYGGKWMADSVFPHRFKPCGLIGLSTNQQFMGLPKSVPIMVDDVALLRPQQSEFVMQLFGALKIMRDGKLIDEWDVLPLA